MTQKPYKCRVEYLGGNGNQYIDIGFKLKNTHTAEMKLKTGATTGACGIFGSRSGAASNNFSIQIGNSADLVCDFNNSNYSTYRYYEISSANTEYTLFISKNKRTINGTGNTTVCNDTIETPDNGYLFGVSGSPLTTNKFVGNIYYCKILDGETLVRDFIPVLDLSGRPAMYDQVSGQLFYNQGSGEFTYGRQIIPVEYLESNGEQYIDTGVEKGSVSIIRTIADLSFNDLSTINAAGWGQSLFGGCFGFKQNATYIYFNLTGTDENSTLGYTAGKRLKFDLDGVNGTFTIYDGESVAYTATRTSSTSTSNNVGILFGFKNTSGINTKAQTIYGYKMYKNNVLVRDFIPCIDENLTPFMFDLVTNTCYLNAGTGQFKVGPNVEKVWGGKKLRRKLALALANLKKKRPFYCECEYLESTGTQYIDLGITSKSPIRAQAKFNLANVSAQAVFGSATTSGSGVGVFLGTASNGVVYCNKTNTAISPSLTLVANTNYTFDMSLTTVSINGVNYTASTTTDNNYNMLLFARTLAGNVDRRISGKIYYFKLYDNDVLIRDMIPVLDWDMTPCMFDKVTEQLFYNAGPGDFIAGREIHPVEYLESSGTQRIDAGVSTAEGICTEVKFKLNSITSTSQVVFGKIGSTTPPMSRYWFGAQGSSLKWYYAVNKYITTSANADSDIHTVVLDTVNNVCTLDGETIATFSDLNSNSETISLFSIFYQGSLNNPMSGRIYYTKIWNNGTLVRDFIPAIDENGVGFMFDRVSHTCFLNAGTGAFVPASYQLDGNGRVVEPEYE